jgi:hypothetical protein
MPRTDKQDPLPRHVELLQQPTGQAPHDRIDTKPTRADHLQRVMRDGFPVAVDELKQRAQLAGRPVLAELGQSQLALQVPVCTVAAEPAKDSPAARVSFGSPQLTARLRDTFALHQNHVDCELLDRDGIHPTVCAVPATSATNSGPTHLRGPAARADSALRRRRPARQATLGWFGDRSGAHEV